MRTPSYITSLMVVSASLLTALPALAEFQCAPANTSASLPTRDAFFASEMAAWSKTTRSRYTEGKSASDCRDVTVPGYEGFPTQRCTYENADAGVGMFPALKAQVIILDPSAQQLAAWSINACRVNGATDASMPKCLDRLRNNIIVSNGAQFPVVGSVVESYCNSSGAYGECKSLPKNSPWLRPRHTWFRDGVSVDFKPGFGVHWDDKDYMGLFDKLLDVTQSDRQINTTYKTARIAAAERDQWRSWRRHIGKPEMTDGVSGTVDGAGWRTVAASVHRAACRGSSNELFDAVVFANKSWTTR